MTSRAKRLHKMLLETYGGMMDEIDARMGRGEDVPDSLVKNMVLNKEKEGLDWLDMTILCSAFMIGGIETVRGLPAFVLHFLTDSFQTASLMQWFTALIPAYPEIQAKAHAELDKIVGRDRLPTLEDEKDLPYIHAIIKVCPHIVFLPSSLFIRRAGGRALPKPLLAWHSASKYTGLYISRPIYSKGYRFDHEYSECPYQTIAGERDRQLSSQYTMHHDPVRYPDPHAFNVSPIGSCQKQGPQTPGP